MRRVLISHCLTLNPNSHRRLQLIHFIPPRNNQITRCKVSDLNHSLRSCNPNHPEQQRHVLRIRRKLRFQTLVQP